MLHQNVTAMKPALSYIISLLILLQLAVCADLIAQDETSPDVETAPVDTTSNGLSGDVKGKFGIELYLDYGKLATWFTDFEDKAEGGINIILFRRLAVLGEYGYAKLSPTEAYRNAEFYNSTGNYYRVGAGYIAQILPRTFYTVGLLYGSSSFEDEGKVFINDNLWDDFEQEFGDTGLSANWIELFLQTETEMKKVRGLMFGLNLRLRFQLDFPSRAPVNIYAIPGYGRNFDKSIPVANLYVKYLFRFKEK